MSDVIDLIGGPDTWERETTMRVRVTRAPDAFTDPLEIEAVNLADAPYEVPGGQWMTRGTAMPALDDTGLLIFDDDGDAWLVAWDGDTSAAGGGSDPAKKWLSGAGAPTAGDGATGDWWLHTGTGDVYEKLVGGWTLRANIKGPKGDKGATGDKGNKGDAGLSAYEVWLAAGNSGDVNAYLASLKGPKGDKGDKGAPGLNWRGVFDPVGSSYLAGDAVFYEGTSWRALVALPAPAPAPLDALTYPPTGAPAQALTALGQSISDSSGPTASDYRYFAVDVGDTGGTLVFTVTKASGPSLSYTTLKADGSSGGSGSGSFSSTSTTQTIPAAQPNTRYFLRLHASTANNIPFTVTLSPTSTASVGAAVPWAKVAQKGDKGDQGPAYVPPPLVWNNLPLNATNWANFASGWQTAQYAKDIQGLVHVRGLVKSVAAYAYSLPATHTIGTLPVGFRPAAGVMAMAWQIDTNSDPAVLRLQVEATGVIRIAPTGGTASGSARDSISAQGNNGNAALLTLELLQPFSAA